MNTKTLATDSGVGPDLDDDEFTMLDLLITMAKNKRMIAFCTLGVTLLSAAICYLLLANVYKSDTKILPPQQGQSSASALLAQLGGVAGAMAASAGAGKSPSDLYIGLLRSRTVTDNLIKEFDLKSVYDQKFLDKTRKELEENTRISTGKDGIISVEVEDSDPKRAAGLANGYALQLLRLTKTMAVTEAAQRRLFFERQLETSKNNLAQAEAALKNRLGTMGVVSVDAESQGLVETVARLRAQIAVKEIQLNSMGSFVTPNNPDFKRLQQEIISMKSELSKFENGEAHHSSSDGKPAGLENIKTLREVKYHQMLYELLAKQYEAARLDEAKDSSIVQVLDPAVVPERPVRPRRVVIVIFSFLGALTVSVLLSLVLGLIQSRRNDEKSAMKLRQLSAYLKSF